MRNQFSSANEKIRIFRCVPEPLVGYKLSRVALGTRMISPRCFVQNKELLFSSVGEPLHDHGHIFAWPIFSRPLPFLQFQKVVTLCFHLPPPLLISDKSLINLSFYRFGIHSCLATSHKQILKTPLSMTSSCILGFQATWQPTYMNYWPQWTADVDLLLLV